MLLTPRILDIFVRATDSFTGTVLIQDTNGDPVDLSVYTYETNCPIAATFVPDNDTSGRIELNVPAAETGTDGQHEYTFVLISGLERQTLLAGAIRVQEHHRAQSWASISGGGQFDTGGEIAQALLVGVVAGPQGATGATGATGPQGDPGLDGGISPDPLDTVPIYSAADFPAPVADVITLDPAKAYVLRGDVYLGSARLEGTVINLRGEKSIGPYAYSLISTNATATVAATGTVILLSVSAVNIGAGAAITNTAGPTGITFGNFSAAVSVANWAVDVTGGAILAWQDGPMNGYLGGLRAAGSISDLFLRQVLFFAQSGAPAYKAVRLESSLVAGRVMLVNPQWSAVQATDIGLSVDSAITVTAPVRILGGYFAGAMVPIDPAGVQKTEAKLLVTDTVGVDDSRMVGTLRFAANTALTTFAAPNVLVSIGNGTPAHPLFTEGAEDERFVMSGATTATQVLTYTGLLPATFVISADMNVSKSGGAQTGEIAIAVNGTPLADSAVTMNVTSSFAFIRTEIMVALNPGDALKPLISNESGTTSFAVRSCAVYVRRVR